VIKEINKKLQLRQDDRLSSTIEYNEDDNYSDAKSRISVTPSAVGSKYKGQIRLSQKVRKNQIEGDQNSRPGDVLS